MYTTTCDSRRQQTSKWVRVCACCVHAKEMLQQDTYDITTSTWCIKRRTAYVTRDAAMVFFCFFFFFSFILCAHPSLFVTFSFRGKNVPSVYTLDSAMVLCYFYIASFYVLFLSFFFFFHFLQIVLNWSFKIYRYYHIQFDDHLERNSSWCKTIKGSLKAILPTYIRGICNRCNETYARHMYGNCKIL